MRLEIMLIVEYEFCFLNRTVEVSPQLTPKNRGKPLVLTWGIHWTRKTDLTHNFPEMPLTGISQSCLRTKRKRSSRLPPAPGPFPCLSRKTMAVLSLALLWSTNHAVSVKVIIRLSMTEGRRSKRPPPILDFAHPHRYSQLLLFQWKWKTKETLNPNRTHFETFIAITNFPASHANWDRHEKYEPRNEERSSQNVHRCRTGRGLFQKKGDV